MLGRIHFYIGLLVIIIFVLTGQYMKLSFNRLIDMELISRALFRTGHLYILLFGLINISLGINFQISKEQVFKRIQQTASGLMFTATLLVIFSFFTELPRNEIERPISRYSLYFILAGVSIHGLVYLFKDIKLGQKN